MRNARNKVGQMIRCAPWGGALRLQMDDAAQLAEDNLDAPEEVPTGCTHVHPTWPPMAILASGYVLREAA